MGSDGTNLGSVPIIPSLGEYLYIFRVQVDPTSWSERTDLTVVTIKSRLMGTTQIESVGGDESLSKRVNLGSGHGEYRRFAVNYCGRPLGIIVVQMVRGDIIDQ